MAYEGMEVDAVRAVAQQLGTQAAQLASLIPSVDHLVAQALHEWEGRDAHDFHGWWTSQHRPKLQALHQDLVLAQSHLQEQVAAQEQASGLNGADQDRPSAAGWAHSASVAGVMVGRAWATLQDVDHARELATDIVGGAAYLAAHQLVGAYPKGWNDLSPLFQIKRSPVLHGVQGLLRDTPGAAEHLPRVAAGLEKLSPLGTAVGVVDAGVQGGQSAAEFLDGNVHDGVYDGAESAATTLKTAGTQLGPVAYLSGVIVQEGVEIGKAAEQADWSADGWKLVSDELTNDPFGAITAGAQADIDWMKSGLVRVFL